MKNETREFFSVLKFLLIIGVVFIHAPKELDTEIFADLFSKILPAAAVPLFFGLSGMFLFRKNLLSWDVFFGELRKRFRSLLCPFLFWNVSILILSAMFLYIAPSFSIAGPYTVNVSAPLECICAILGIGRYPIHYQFWFLRNLMVFFLLSPLLKWSLGRYELRIILFVFLCVLMSIDVFNGIGWFYLGGLGSLNDNYDFLPIKRPLIPFIGSLIVMVLLQGEGHFFFVVLLNSTVFFITLASLLVNLRFRMDYFVPFTFIIYAVHEPTITILKKVLVREGFMEMYPVLCYFSVPLISICISMFVGIIWSKVHRNSYLFATGGR